MEMKNTIGLVLLLIVIVLAIVLLDNLRPGAQINVPEGGGIEIDTSKLSAVDKARYDQKAVNFKTAKDVSTPDGFINTDEFMIEDFIGKNVILIDFWTYSCINCQRTTPYLNSWHDKYSDKGLVIVGVHTPEFEFEKDYDNVRDAVTRFGIEYPVVLDNDYSTWRAYGNRYWPRKYLIDIDGFIVYDHIGEGAYDETERHIQRLLNERNQVLGNSDSIPFDITVPDERTGVNFNQVKSPETYFGAKRNVNVGNGPVGSVGIQDFEITYENILPNMVYYDGTWHITDDYAENKNNGRILFKYSSMNVYMVASSDEGVSVDILLDGEYKNTMEVKEERLYQLVQGQDYGDHTLEIVMDDPGLKIFTLTFG